MKHAAHYDCMETLTDPEGLHCEDTRCIFWTICNKYREQRRIETMDAYIENLDEENARIIQARGM